MNKMSGEKKVIKNGWIWAMISKAFVFFGLKEEKTKKHVQSAANNNFKRKTK